MPRNLATQSDAQKMPYWLLKYLARYQPIIKGDIVLVNEIFNEHISYFWAGPQFPP